MKMARAILLLVTFMLFVGCGVAVAAEVKIDLGITKLSPIENGNWYQDGFPHTLHLTSPSAAIGVYTDPTPSGWQLGVGAMEVARMYSYAKVLDDDKNYNQDSPTHCNGTCGYLSTMHGRGNINNWFFALRKNEGKGFFQVAFTETTYHWKTTNDDWYGPGNTMKVGPIVSVVVADPRTSYGVAVSAGYQIYKPLSFVFKLDPTHTATGNPGLSRGVSPTFALEYTF